MHVRDRAVFLDDATRLAGFRALRPAGVASIYYDEHTPESSSHSGDPELQGLGGGSYTGQLRSPGQLDGMPEANLEMDWDIDEPPTQMWAPGHALALQRASSQRVPAQRAPSQRVPSQPPAVPTRSGMRPPPPPPEALRASQRPAFAGPSSAPPSPARRTGQHPVLAGHVGAAPSPARRTGQHQTLVGHGSAAPSPARRTGQHQAFEGQGGAAPSPARRTGQHQAFAGQGGAAPSPARRTGQHQAFAGQAGAPANRTDSHQVFAGQVRRTGQHQAAAAHLSQPVQAPTGVRPRSISETRTRSVRAADSSASQSIPQLQWAPPPRPRDALFPELAEDSNFYPGLVPAKHSFDDDENPFAHKRSKGLLWYAAYAAVGLTVIGAGVALFKFLSGPATVSVVIETTPRDATVTIDGHALASAISPFTKEGLATGEHLLQVQKSGFEDYRQALSLSETETKRIVSVNLNAIPKAEPPPVEPIAAPQPQVEAPPPPVSRWHAKPKESASTAGMTPQEIAKQHRSEVRAAKIAARWREAHGLPPRENTLADSVDVTEVSRPAHAKREPREPREPRQAPAPRESKSESTASAEAAPAAGSSTATGTLQINSRPWANVYVDGQMVGHTPQMGLPLRAGRHAIRLENPTMNMSKTLSVTIQAGQTLTKVETLSE